MQSFLTITLTATLIWGEEGEGEGGMSMREGTAKYIKACQILSPFRNIILVFQLLLSKIIGLKSLILFLHLYTTFFAAWLIDRLIIYELFN